MKRMDIGKRIADCRKEKGLTRAQLAEKLNIADSAVSRWETGKCMPDPSVMPELCSILGVPVHELSSGESAGMDPAAEKVSEHCVEPKRKEKNTRKRNTMLSILYTGIMGTGILVCCICDAAVSGTLTWSLITLSSILTAWIVSFPVILLGKKGLMAAMTAVSVLILPFIYLLSILIKVHEVFRIGAVMSAAALVFLWGIYILFCRLKKRKLLAAGITFLLAVPFTCLSNIILSKMIGEPAMDVWDILAVLILLTAAVAFFIGDYARKKDV